MRVSFELFVSCVGFACVVIVVALVVYLVVARTLPLLRLLRDEKGPKSFQKKMMLLQLGKYLCVSDDSRLCRIAGIIRVLLKMEFSQDFSYHIHSTILKYLSVLGRLSSFGSKDYSF